MKELHLVKFTADRDGLILAARKGGKSGGFKIVLDDDLLEHIDELRAELGALPRGERRRGSSTRRVRSALSVRELQARLRGGATVAEVAAEAGVDPAWVERFAAPVLAEQNDAIERATRLTVKTPRRGTADRPLVDAVALNLAERGLRITERTSESGWSAYHHHGSKWNIRYTFRQRGREMRAEWRADLAEGTLVCENRLAVDLGFTAPDDSPGGSVAEPAAARTPATPARGVTGDSRRPATTRQAPRALATADAVVVGAAVPAGQHAAARTTDAQGASARHGSAAARRSAARPGQADAQAKAAAAAKKAADREKAAARREAQQERDAVRKAAAAERAEAKKAADREKAAARREAQQERDAVRKAAAAERAAAKRAADREKAAARREAERERTAQRRAAAAAKRVADREEAVAKKTAAKQATAEKAAAKKLAAKEAAAEKAAARKLAAADKAKAKKAAAKKAPVAKAAAKKAAAKKASDVHTAADRGRLVAQSTDGPEALSSLDAAPGGQPDPGPAAPPAVAAAVRGPGKPPRPMAPPGATAAPPGPIPAATARPPGWVPGRPPVSPIWTAPSSPPPETGPAPAPGPGAPAPAASPPPGSMPALPAPPSAPGQRPAIPPAASRPGAGSAQRSGPPAPAAPPPPAGLPPAGLPPAGLSPADEGQIDDEQWSALQPPDAAPREEGTQGAAVGWLNEQLDELGSRRRRARLLRDSDKPRRPLRSTQEARKVAARRQEQITGVPAPNGSGGQEQGASDRHGSPPSVPESGVTGGGSSSPAPSGNEAGNGSGQKALDAGPTGPVPTIRASRAGEGEGSDEQPDDRRGKDDGEGGRRRGLLRRGGARRKSADP